jgi:peptidyl-tRNA hydrolase, PTH1 family
MMKIIVFLGNPGRKYSKNRHNAGFIIGKLFADNFNIFLKKKDFHSDCGSGKINGSDVFIIFPDTFMNKSGLAVREAMNYYNTNPEDLIAVHDEIELPFGVIKNKFSGGHKGHNGLRSIIQHIGSADFNRVRIGVGRPENQNIEVADYLLSDFTDEELTKMKDLAPQIIHLILSLINPLS